MVHDAQTSFGPAGCRRAGCRVPAGFTLVEMLIVAITRLDDGRTANLEKMMDDLYAERGFVVN